MQRFSRLTPTAKLFLGGLTIPVAYVTYQVAYPARSLQDELRKEPRNREFQQSIRESAGRAKDKIVGTTNEVKEELKDIGSGRRPYASRDSSLTTVKSDDDILRSSQPSVTRSSGTLETEVPGFRGDLRDTKPGKVTDNRASIIGQHAKGAWEDAKQGSLELGEVARVHGKLAGRDFKQGASEVGQALFGDRIPTEAKVRDTPDLRFENPSDDFRRVPIEAGQRGEGTIGDRFRAAKEIISEHASAADEDLDQAKAEAKTVYETHRKYANRDIDNAKREMDITTNIDAPVTPHIKQSPPSV